MFNKNFILAYWYSDLEKITGIPNKTEIEKDKMPEVISKIFNLNLNIMLYNGDEKNIIFVDANRFSQR